MFLSLLSVAHEICVYDVKCMVSRIGMLGYWMPETIGKVDMKAV